VASSKNDHVTQTMPLSDGISFTLGLGLAVLDHLAKFKECNLISSRNNERGLTFLKGSHDPDHAPFRGNFLLHHVFACFCI